MTAGTVGTAFLAGIGLEDHEGLPWLGWVALGGVVLATIFALWALFPLHLGVAIDTETMAKPEWTSLSSDDLSRHLAMYFGKRANANATKLTWRWTVLGAAILSTATSIICWVALIATR